MNNYALTPGEIELDGELTGMGAHTDYGIVTVLWADQVRGPQVLGHDGSWNDVVPVDGALLAGSKYPPVTVAEHLAAKLAGSRAGVANTAAERKAERVRAAAAG